MKSHEITALLQRILVLVGEIQNEEMTRRNICFLISLPSGLSNRNNSHMETCWVCFLLSLGSLEGTPAANNKSRREHKYIPNKE